MRSFPLVLFLAFLCSCGGGGSSSSSSDDGDKKLPVTIPLAPTGVVMEVWGDSTNNSCGVSPYGTCWFSPAISWDDNSDNEGGFKITLRIHSANCDAEYYYFTAPPDTNYYEISPWRYIDWGSASVSVTAYNAAGESVAATWWMLAEDWCKTCDDFY
jgi:hypothetical protein